MKKFYFTSFTLHTLLIVLLLVLQPEARPWDQSMTIYPVELVNISPIIENARVIETESEEQEAETVAEVKKPKEEALDISRPITNKTHEEKREEPEQPEKKTESSGIADSVSLKIDIQDFPFAYYMTILKNRVRSNWNPPYQISAPADKISTIIGFKIMRNGNITDVNIEKSSQRYLYDQAAERAVYYANPLPPLPEEFHGEYLIVHIEFE
ncbi:TonB C-terminal domain-containing protein [candidate division KSB1 bacterium]|nr:TonB C-terminal domain-containing protein [candidate division KSB1 bacterium]